ncbi:DUF86 domain-containing protein [Mumia zhuanghuii]|uniref:DUF86 domain-containing protein n=1 Tax=Mumia zhuanghuii TaxID=2585211 RepID=A0A5C4N1W8_9ACTN|nr:HepT-like ribonuclease domain-containing protein [Mumia zhuanghuii]TNC52587.1 DUF86 domain-containing protein [Mumia zhuanghuii]TNC52679.1 DUF86 domain-containing protein [Mumia zhuanghuii]
MQPKTPALLWDASRAATRIKEFCADRTWSDYASDPMLRAAVERQFEIIGEALGRVRKIDPDVASEIPYLPQIISFRNLLIHGYAVVNDSQVWANVTTDVDPLIEVLQRLLPELPEV